MILGLVGTAMLLLALAVAAHPAHALDQAYVQDGASFGSGPGAGDGELNHPRRIAVDESTGNIFVADRDNDRIVVFSAGTDPAGTYLTDFGQAELDAPFGVAIDQGSGDVYVTSAGDDKIVKFESDGAPTPTFSVDGSFTSPASGSGTAEIGDFEADIAVDQTNGDILVADPGNNLVKRFDSSGAHKANFDGSSSEGGAFTGLLDLDVAPNGDIYVVDATGPLYEEGEQEGGSGPCVQNFYCNSANTSRTLRFDLDGSEGETLIPPGIDSYGLVAFDPNNSQILVARVNPQNGKVVAYRSDGSGPVASFGTHTFNFTPFTGIAIDANAPRAYLATDTVHHENFNADVGAVEIRAFRPVNYPTIVDGVDVSEVTSDSAHLEATVNPNGEPTNGRFEYGRNGEWQLLPEQDLGDGSSPVSLEADLQDLAPAVEYQVRLKVKNEVGVEVTSAETSFTTAAIAPSVVTGGSAPRTQTSARINGWVDPNNLETTYQFEFGPTTSYGTTLPANPGEVGSGDGPVAVSAELADLAPGATYHFRLVATNATGTTTGADQAFTTRTASETGPRKRGIELVSNPDKGNAPVTLPFGGIVASPDASKILWTVTSGAPGATTGTGNTFMAERTATGWKSRTLLPPADQLVDGGMFPYEAMRASPEYDKFLFVVTSWPAIGNSPRAFVTVDSDYNQTLLGRTGAMNQWVLGASDDFAHVYSDTFERHDPAHPAGTPQVYDFSQDPPELASVLPDGTVPACGVVNTPDSSQWGGNVATAPGGPARIFFNTGGALPCSKARLYLRDLDTDTTTLLSGPALPGGPQGESGGFLRASADGSTVIYWAESRLAPEDQNNSGDVYRYTIGEERECLTCGEGGGGGVSSTVVSEDLSRIYFVSSNALVTGAGQAGTSNLYLWHDGEIEYIAPVSGGIGGELAEGDEVFFFRSENPQTTTDPNGGFEQTYRYDENDRSIECVTCVAGHTPTNTSKPGVAGGSAEHGDAWVFMTVDAIDPRDVNGGNDIYEWRNGILSLVSDGVTQYPIGFSHLRLVGVGDDGLNIMFTAGAHFTGYERDNVAQYYVARVGGGFPRPPGEPAPCGEETCQGPLPPPPVPLAPASTSFQGPGNVREETKKRCVKRKAKKGKKANRKGKCVKRASRSEKKRGNR